MRLGPVNICIPFRVKVPVHFIRCIFPVKRFRFSQKKRIIPGMSFLTSLFGDANKRYTDSLAPIIEKINSFEPELQKLSEEGLKEKTADFRKRLSEGETLDDILPEAFAVAREAARRALGQRHFDVQLVGGIVLHQGKIAEMRTGEGKTLVATL